MNTPLGLAPHDLAAAGLHVGIGGTTFDFDAGALVDMPRWTLEGASPFVTARVRVAIGQATGLVAALDSLGPGVVAVATVHEPRGTHDSGRRAVVHGAVVRWHRDGPALELEIDGAVLLGLDRPACRDGVALAEARAGGLAVRSPLPQVFGTVANVRAVPLFARRRARLQADVEASDGSILLARAVDWPVPGRVQIGGEVLSYTALAGGGHILQTAPRPGASAHRAGSIATWLPGAPLRWVAADHPAEILEILDGVDGADVADAFTIVAGTLGGRAATWLESDRLPLSVRTRAETAERRSSLSPGTWTIDPASSASAPGDAFAPASQALGAVLSQWTPLLKATLAEDLAPGAVLYGTPVGLRLSFTGSYAPNPDGVGLRLRLARGTSQWQREIIPQDDRPGQRASVTGTAQIQTHDEAPVTGTARAGGDAVAFHFDCGALLDDAARWDGLRGDGVMELEMELFNTTPNFSFAVVEARITVEYEPVASLGVVEAPYCTVRGRLAGGDGACDPEAVVRALVEDPAFGGRPGDEVDGVGFSDQGIRLAAGGIRFRRAFASRRPLGNVLASALAESDCLLAQHDGLWTLRPAPPPPDASSVPDAITLGADDLLEPGGPVSASPPLSTDAGGVVLLRPPTTAVPSPDPQVSTADIVELRWLAAGHAAIGARTNPARGMVRLERRAGLHPRWRHLAPGTIVLLDGMAWVVSAIHWDGGRHGIELVR